jgi:hypothetical protein
MSFLSIASPAGVSTVSDLLIVKSFYLALWVLMKGLLTLEKINLDCNNERVRSFISVKWNRSPLPHNRVDHDQSTLLYKTFASLLFFFQIAVLVMRKSCWKRIVQVILVSKPRLLLLTVPRPFIKIFRVARQRTACNRWRVMKPVALGRL